MVNRSQTCEESKSAGWQSAALKEQTEGLWLEHSGPSSYDVRLERNVGFRKCQGL